MAGFRFLQLSDLHLGRPFTWLPPDKAELRRADQRDLLWRAIQVAIERKLEAVLIAGDLFDGEVVDRETIARAIECVSQPGCPPVFIAPGNHDCFSRSTFYYDNRRLVAAGQAPWPEHVHIFSSPRFDAASVPGRSDVTVWGRCVHENVDMSERVLAADRPTLEPGRLHVLVMHGSRDGSLPPGKKVTAPFNDAELLAWGADYAALGHYHRPARILDEDGVVRGSYSGSPIALALDETGQRYVQIITVDHNGLHRRVDIDVLELDKRRLHRVEVRVQGIGSPEAMLAKIQDALGTAFVNRDDIVCAELVGRVRPGVSVVPRAEEFKDQCFHLRLDTSGLRPDYDLELYRRSEGLTTEERFGRAMLAEIDAEADPVKKRRLEAALYYGLDALRLGDVAPRYEVLEAGAP